MWVKPIQDLTAMVTKLISEVTKLTRIAKFNALEANANQLILTTQKAKKEAPYGKQRMVKCPTIANLSQD